jgi:putative ABC transport system permease protein
VVGIALDLTDCFYPSCESATVWASPDRLRRLDPRGESSGWTLLVRLRDASAVGAFESRIQTRFGKSVTDIEDWENTRSDTLALNLFFAAFLASFGVVLLFAAGLVVLSTVSAQVLARYRELGMLKAVGFTPRSLVAIVLGENLAVAAVGGILGVLFGTLVAPQLELTVGEVLGDGGGGLFLGYGLLTLGIVLAMVAAAAVLPAWRAGRVPASLAIARTAPPPSTKPSRLARAAAHLRLGAPVAVGLKDSTARPLRAAMTVLALAVTVVAIVATIAFQRTGEAIAEDPALVGSPYDVVVEPGDARAEVEAALAGNASVSSWFTATERRATVGDFGFQIRVLGGDVARSGYVVREGRMLRSPDETVVGYGLLERLGLSVGDRLPLDVSGGRLDLEIVGWYAEGEDTGLIAQIQLAALRRVEPTAAPGEYLVRLRTATDASSVSAAVVRATGGRAEVGLVDRGTDELDAFGAALIGVTLLVLAVGLANLVGTTLLGVRERMRDIGVLKTIGFTPLQVALSVASGSAAYGIAAVLVGVPAGLLTAVAMLDGVGREAGLGPGIAQLPAVAPLVLVAFAIVFVTGAFGLVVARRAASARVAEVLRAE